MPALSEVPHAAALRHTKAGERGSPGSPRACSGLKSSFKTVSLIRPRAVPAIYYTVASPAVVPSTPNLCSMGYLAPKCGLPLARVRLVTSSRKRHDIREALQVAIQRLGGFRTVLQVAADKPSPCRLIPLQNTDNGTYVLPPWLLQGDVVGGVYGFTLAFVNRP